MHLHPDMLPAVHTRMVDAWLTSLEFEKLQQFELYDYHETEHQEFVPTPLICLQRIYNF